MAPGSDAGFDLVSKHLLFKGLVEIPALLLFWCLCCVTPPCFCIYVFPSTCRSHTVLPCPGTSLGTSPARPSPGIPIPETFPQCRSGRSEVVKGSVCPHSLLQSCSHLLCSHTPTASAHEGSPCSPGSTGQQPCATASSFAGDPWPVSRRCRDAVLPEPRPFPRWSLHVRACVSTWHHLHFALLQSGCAASKEGNKGCKGIYIPSERGCWSVRFHLLPRVSGCRGAAVGWRVHPWCPSCPWPQG